MTRCIELPKSHGLTLGKFAPFHKGHQFLIETALAEVDALTVIIYDEPTVTPIPVPIRAQWIRHLYPQVRVVEAWDGPTAMGDTPEIKRQHEDYVIHDLGISGITHFYSSEFYGDHMSAALGAVNRLVNPDRTTIPISATKIRTNPFLNREYLHPIVYSDLIANIVFLGAPSTGKTTLTERLAEVYQTTWMPEYGREYWDTHQVDRRLSLEQLVEIAEGHVEREDACLQAANQYLFTDTNAITTLLFSRYYHQTTAPRLIELANLARSRYDLVFVCDTDMPYDDTWDRSGEANRRVFQKQILSELHARNIPYITLRGNLETRIAKVQSVLNQFHKYQSLLDTQFAP
jgi:HTH-type transcriptional regulator, transcriptional repressor of NAD biosynthesis genes